VPLNSSRSWAASASPAAIDTAPVIRPANSDTMTAPLSPEAEATPTIGHSLDNNASLAPGMAGCSQPVRAIRNASPCNYGIPFFLLTPIHGEVISSWLFDGCAKPRDGMAPETT